MAFDGISMRYNSDKTDGSAEQDPTAGMCTRILLYTLRKLNP